MTIGESIKKARTKAGYTQKELAQKCGLAEITIRQYENNKREPRDAQKQKIAAALGIDTSELFYAPIDHLDWSDERMERDKLIDYYYSTIVPILKKLGYQSHCFEYGDNISIILSKNGDKLNSELEISYDDMVSVITEAQNFTDYNIKKYAHDVSAETKKRLQEFHDNPTKTKGTYDPDAIGRSSTSPFIVEEKKGVTSIKVK